MNPEQAERKADMKKERMLILILLVCLFAGCGKDKGTAQEQGTETSLPGEEAMEEYSMVITAWDTPRQVLDELKSRGCEYTEYYDGALLLREETAALGDVVSIYLCEGTYEVDSGDFIQADCTNKVSIQGAGADKTIIRARSSVRQSRGSAVDIVGGGEKAVTVKDLTIIGFEYGIQIRNAQGVVLENLVLEQNRNAGVRLAGAWECQISGCIFRENGEPQKGDTGYGLMLDAESFGNTGDGNGYLNNGNRNVVDRPALWQSDTDNDNLIELEKDYTLPLEAKELKDPVIEARNARPDENSLRFEAEEGGFYGAAEVSQGKMPEASGGKYMFLADGALFFRVNVPEEGYYRVFVAGGSDDGNNKCDKFSINGGQEYLTSFPWQGEAAWQLSQPGLEVWTNNVLTPEAPVEGFWFNEGENMITVTANWGYCCYDCVYLDKIAGNGGTK
jgi:parallel beta-helix repeat protein